MPFGPAGSGPSSAGAAGKVCGGSATSTRCRSAARVSARNFVLGNNPVDRLFDGTALDAVEQLGASSARGADAALVAVVRPDPRARKWAPIERGACGRGPGSGHPDRAGPLRSFELRGRDPSVLPRSGHGGQRHAPVRGGADRHPERLPLLSAVPDERDRLRGRARTGTIDGHFRERTLPLRHLQARFPSAELPKALTAQLTRRRPTETVDGRRGGSAAAPAAIDYYAAFLADRRLRDPAAAHERSVRKLAVHQLPLAEAGRRDYGRSPVAKALPDIHTANKVVELILTNASIAATGIWTAEDDGVLNPATIRLVPRAIIPKAAGSSGLTPLPHPATSTCRRSCCRTCAPASAARCWRTASQRPRRPR